MSDIHKGPCYNPAVIMDDRNTLTRAVKAEARRLGFHLVGVTTPEPPPHLDIYERWLENGQYADMDWIATGRARERRADPRLVLPECKSILVLGIAYPPSPPPISLEAGKDAGKIASYALGADYHDVLPPRLHSIVAFIESQVGEPIPNRCYTDTGPILERELAQRAGLGWIGKNTCLIDPKMGSYFLLAEILLGFELEIDPSFTSDHCGTCTRCLEACPTSCILPDRTVDANRCISYLTIEHRDFIPQDLRPVMQDWVFGCDVCQQVCPWNQKFAAPICDKAFSPNPEEVLPTLRQELSLSPQEFNRKFQNSPVKRARRRGYLRNVAVTLGNGGNPENIPALIQALRDSEPLIRGHAAWALGRIGGKKAVQALRHARENEVDPRVLAEIEAAIISPK